MGNILLDAPSILNMDSRYLKHPLEAVSFSSNFTVPLNIVFMLKLNSMYFVLCRLNLKSYESHSCLYHSNIAIAMFPVLSTKIMSSAYDMHHGMSPCIDQDPLRKVRLSVKPCWPIVIAKSYVAAPHALTFFLLLDTYFCVILMYFLSALLCYFHLMYFS